MGANQSSGSHPNPAPPHDPTQARKVGYYELLGVNRQASEEEIRKAYRKKALELHPDRNYGNVENAIRLFAEIQAAYEVLSDPQERAWYDSHEAAILGGPGDHDGGGVPTGSHYERSVGITTADDVLRIITRFHSAVDFSDSPTGFFGFLRDTFARLAREEDAAAASDGSDPVDYPPFGHKADAYEDVARPFYAVWSGFATRKSFSWRDVHRYSDAPDRRYRRMMEKENRRLREEAVREFNDAVRSLVAFVRKRDPRHVPNMQAEAERQAALRNAAAAQAARSRAANAAKLEGLVPEWTKSRDLDESEESVDSEVEQQLYECVACRKTFKSEKQYDAHEKSKKHAKAVQSLSKQMRREDSHLKLVDEPSPRLSFSSPSEAQSEAENDVGLDRQDRGPIRVMEDDEADHYLRQTESGNEGHSRQLEVAEDDSQADLVPGSSIQGSSAQGVDEADSGQRPSKVGKAAQKRAKRAAQQAAANQGMTNYTCKTCNAGFPSKTRLFQHINDFRHAAPPPADDKGTRKGKSKR